MKSPNPKFSIMKRRRSLKEDRRALQEERRPGVDRKRLVLLAEGLEHDGHVGAPSPDGAGEVDPRLGGSHAVPRELDVGDDAEDLLAVLLECLQGLLVGSAEEDLGPRAHPHALVREIHPFREEAMRVGDHFGRR